jgi:hypothetical protein
LNPSFSPEIETSSLQAVPEFESVIDLTLNPINTHILAGALSQSQLASELATKAGLTKKACVEILDHLAALA